MTDKNRFYLTQKDGQKILVDEFSAQLFTGETIQLAAIENEEMVTISLPGIVRACHNYKLEKFQGFKLFHAASIHTLHEFHKLLYAQQIKPSSYEQGKLIQRS